MSGEIKKQLCLVIDSLKPLVTRIATSLYENPELGLEEVFACGLLSEMLKENGFSVEQGVANLPTSFVATAGKGKTKIAFMAEYDALPGIGHGCGHNLMAACAVAAGVACKSVIPGVEWMVIGTPAEETIGGKVIMVEAGVFDDVDAAFIAHPGQRNSVGPGISWASHPLEMTFYGKTAHAGGNPQAGINALDACVMAYLSIRNLRNHMRDDIRVAGIVTHGGDAPNVIPEKASARFTLRCTDSNYLENVLIPAVKRCAEAAAMAVGAKVEFRHHESLFRETLHYPVLIELAKKNFEYVGLEVPPPLPTSGGGVTDVGNVTWVTPSIQIGFRISGARGHSVELADATVKPEGIAGAIAAAKVLALTAYDLVREPDRLEEAKVFLRSKQ
jgi:amidohydrolase